MALPVEGSNSLADLAARINAEHEAVGTALKRGLEHAVAAGNLLIEAKAQLKHGGWLAWLKDNCSASLRTAQAYMRVAKSFATLGDEAKAQRVALFSLRETLESLAGGESVIGEIELENDQAETWTRAIKRVAREDARARFTLETPASMLPSLTGRKIRVARNAAERRWMLAIGPSISRAALKEKEQAARETAPVRLLQQEHDELVERAAALEAEAKALREKAESVHGRIVHEVTEIAGPATPFTETYDFQCDEHTDAELASLPQNQLVDRLLAARGTVNDELAEIDRGYWGDMALMAHLRMHPGAGRGWTQIGSPEWLDELFPAWNEAAS